MRISDWSSDVCSSDLSHPEETGRVPQHLRQAVQRLRAAGEVEGDGKVSLAAQDEAGRRHLPAPRQGAAALEGGQIVGLAESSDDLLQIGRASCRERECQYV